MLSLEKKWLVGAILETGSHPPGGLWRSGNGHEELASSPAKGFSQIREDLGRAV